MKEYQSQSFKTRIEVNLANISSSPDDEFSLHSAYYDSNLFDCELCGHKGCVYAFEVKNLKTDKILKVGSECIHHFKDKGVDIDLAEGLMKRVMSATQSARSKLIANIGKEEYDSLSKEEKRKKITEQYMIEQTKELLKDVSRNKTILTEDQVQHILDLGLGDEYEKAKERAEKKQSFDKAMDVAQRFEDYINSLKQDWSEPDPEIVESYKKEYLQYSANTMTIDRYLKEYTQRRDSREKYRWLINYNGKNNTVKDIQNKFLRNGYISENQEKYARSLMYKEFNSNNSKLEEAFDFIFSQNIDNEFIRSLHRQYKRKGFLSEKQEKALMKTYLKKKVSH
jgi:hypothetical protein